MKLYWPNSEMPHGYVCGTPVHIVYRLAGYLPVGVLKELSSELLDQLTVLRKLHPPPADRIKVLKEEYFNQYDALLDAQDQSKYALSDQRAMKVVVESWKTLHNAGDCRIHVVCVMGNHVHVLLSAWPDAPEVKLGFLIRRHKSFTSTQLKRHGFTPPTGEHSIWASGFFDRYVRPNTFEVVFKYVVDNPKKAGLIANGREFQGIWIP